MSIEYKTFTVTVYMEIVAPANADLSLNNIQQAIEEHIFENGGNVGDGIHINSAEALVNECGCATCKKGNSNEQ